jgi:hypothetical protein
VFDNRLLRRIFGPKVEENYIMRSFITCTLLPSIIRIIKSRRMRWAGRVKRMGRR